MAKFIFFQHHLPPALARVPVKGTGVLLLPLTTSTIAVYSVSETFVGGSLSFTDFTRSTRSISLATTGSASPHVSAVSAALSFALRPSTIACSAFSGPPAELSLLRKKPGATNPVMATATTATTAPAIPIQSPFLRFFGGAGGPPKPWPYWWVCWYCCWS
jgi:hypothetical protein